MTEAQAKPAKKAAAKKKPAEHPKYIDMISQAIVSLKERSGSSRQAITKYIKENFKVGDNCDSNVKIALRREVKSSKLIQVKGTGASGSFKVAQKKAATTKKPAAAKKPVAKKAGKKPAAKKAVVKKTPKKVKKPASGTPKKKAAKPSAKKSAKKSAAKKPAKKTATKKKAAAKGKGKK